MSARGLPSPIAQRRRDAGLTQEELAERAGLSVRGLRDLERGAVGRPRRTTLVRLADALGLDGTDRDRFVRGDLAPLPGRQPVPAQLPPTPTYLVGRAPELTRLDELFAARRDRRLVVTVDGIGGVGKTALVTSWAHAHRDDFPDGQLFVDLRGQSSDAPVRPTRALSTLISALGVPGQQIPPDLEGRTALLRTVVADRRLLLVADNARSAEQVRPLLPGGPSCVVLVTSRRRLDGLAIRDDSWRISLGELPRREATALFRAALPGTEHPDPTTEREVIDLCAGLPLAIRLAAGRAAEPESAVHIGADLLVGDDPPDSSIEPPDEATDLESVFSWSLAGLSPSTTRAFLLLGCHPGPTFTIADLATLTGLGDELARRSVRELVVASLVNVAGGPVYRLHDLLARFARRRGRAALGAEEQERALERLLDRLVEHCDAAQQALEPTIPVRVPGHVPRRSPPTRFDDRTAALAWLDAERPTLVAAATAAVALRRPYTQQLAGLLYRYLVVMGHRDEAQSIAADALRAAEQRGDLASQTRLHADLAAMDATRGRARDGIRHAEAALSIARGRGQAAEQARAALFLGNLHGQLGDNLGAVAYLGVCLDVADDTRPELLVAARNQLGHASIRLGRTAEAVEHLRASEALAETIGDQSGHVHALTLLGEAWLWLDEVAQASGALVEASGRAEELDVAEARAWCRARVAMLGLRRDRPGSAWADADEAVRLAQQDGNPYLVAEMLVVRGAAALATGDLALAARDFTEASTLAARTHDGYEEANALQGLARASTSPAVARDAAARATLLGERLRMPAGGGSAALQMLDRRRP